MQSCEERVEDKIKRELDTLKSNILPKHKN